VSAALDVLDGKKPSIAGKDTPLAGAIPPGAIFVGRAVDLADAKLPYKSVLVKEIESLLVTTGQHEGESFASIKLTTKKADAVEQMKAVVDGARAAALLANTKNPQGAKLIEAVKVTVSDNVLGIEWRAPSDAVFAELQKIKEQIERKGWAPPSTPWDPSSQNKEKN
jgi:hypothetical protein